MPCKIIFVNSLSCINMVYLWPAMARCWFITQCLLQTEKAGLIQQLGDACCVNVANETQQVTWLLFLPRWESLLFIWPSLDGKPVDSPFTQPFTHTPRASQVVSLLVSAEWLCGLAWRGGLGVCCMGEYSPAMLSRKQTWDTYQHTTMGRANPWGSPPPSFSPSFHPFLLSLSIPIQSWWNNR